MKKYMCILMVVFVGVMSTSAFGVLDVSQLAWGSTINPAGDTGHYMGQSFVQGAGLTSLEQINAKVFDFQQDGPPYTSVVELHNAAPSPATYDAASLVATSAPTTVQGVVFNADPAIGHVWWDFPGGVAVTPGNAYTFIIKHTAGTWAAAFAVSDVYAGGAYVNNGGGGGDVYPSDFAKDMSFQTFSTPEPATMCLLGLGGLALLRKRRA
jgi:hypothetical protein